MKAYLFEWKHIQWNPQVLGIEKQYTLVYAETPEEAFNKINSLLNPTGNVYEIKLATI